MPACLLLLRLPCPHELPPVSYGWPSCAVLPSLPSALQCDLAQARSKGLVMSCELQACFLCVPPGCRLELKTEHWQRLYDTLERGSREVSGHLRADVHTCMMSMLLDPFLPLIVCIGTITQQAQPAAAQ